MSDAYTGPERRLHERRSNWSHAVETLKRDLIDDLLALERGMRQGDGTVPVHPADTYWAIQLAAIIRRHQEP